jgi:hypothetical protein
VGVAVVVARGPVGLLLGVAAAERAHRGCLVGFDVVVAAGGCTFGSVIVRAGELNSSANARATATMQAAARLMSRRWEVRTVGWEWAWRLSWRE